MGFAFIIENYFEMAVGGVVFLAVAAAVTFIVGKILKWSGR